MATYHWLGVAVIVLAFVGASYGVTVSATHQDHRHFVAILSGAEEVPARDTNARGVALFQVNADGTAMDFKLIVANIRNVFGAHIHCGAFGVNGPVGVTLYGAAAGGGRIQGVIARGEIIAPDVGTTCLWVTLSDVIDDMLAGIAYVNVHTNDGVGGINTGPGDFPGGEIRGQVRMTGGS